MHSCGMVDACVRAGAKPKSKIPCDNTAGYAIPQSCQHWAHQVSGHLTAVRNPVIRWANDNNSQTKKSKILGMRPPYQSPIYSEAIIEVAENKQKNQ